MRPAAALVVGLGLAQAVEDWVVALAQAVEDWVVALAQAVEDWVAALVAVAEEPAQAVEDWVAALARRAVEDQVAARLVTVVAEAPQAVGVRHGHRPQGHDLSEVHPRPRGLEVPHPE